MSPKSSARGWGTITAYRGDRYRVRIQIAGRREERIVPTRAIADATLKALQRRKAEVEAGVARPSGTAEEVRVGDVIPELLAAMRAGTRRVYSPSTLHTYQGELSTLDRLLGSRRISTLRQRDIDATVAAMREAGNGSSHIRHVLDRLAQIIAHAVDAGYIGGSPLPVTRPKYRPPTVTWTPTEREMAQLVAAARADHDRRCLPAVLLAADAGLRAGEIAGLRVADVDLERGVLHVEHRGNGDGTKTGERRVVPILSRRLRSALASTLRRLPQDGRVIGVRDREGLEGVAARAWRSALGIEPRWHGLRRRFATWRAMEGDPLPVIQRWLGHSGIATTMLYVRVPDEALLRGAIGGSAGAAPGAEAEKPSRTGRRGGRAV